jgi:hypothetical protein
MTNKKSDAIMGPSIQRLRSRERRLVVARYKYRGEVIRRRNRLRRRIIVPRIVPREFDVWCFSVIWKGKVPESTYHYAIEANSIKKIRGRER